jgi:hypothetical protein
MCLRSIARASAIALAFLMAFHPVAPNDGAQDGLIGWELLPAFFPRISRSLELPWNLASL